MLVIVRVRSLTTMPREPVKTHGEARVRVLGSYQVMGDYERNPVADAAHFHLPMQPTWSSAKQASVRIGGLFSHRVGRRWTSGKAAANYRFVDFARIVAKGGSGGQGCTSFERLRNGKRGRANGGNGGNGGDVVIRASSSLLGLSIPSTTIQGQNGMNGGPNLSHGQQGQNTVLRVPRGTVIRFLDDKEDNHDWLDIFDEHNDDRHDAQGDPRSDENAKRHSEMDLINDGDEIVVAKGGRGGMGNRTSNMRYMKGVQQIPELGAKGARVRLEIELKILADIGLVGYPNAGKSTLLSAICSARPKIADYPFTTLQPNLGVVEFDNLESSRCTVADIPGLIAGAAEGRGLGHRFLRHIERTKAILYVVDIAGTESRDPIEDYRQMRHELGLYNAEMLRRPSLIFANKIDRRPAACSRNLKRLRDLAGDVPVVAGSAMTRRNMDALLGALFTIVPRTNPW